MNSAQKYIPNSIPVVDITTQRPGWIAHVETWFVRYRDQLVWVHATMFVVFLVLLFLPLFLSEPGEQDTALSHFTVLANYLMWGLWFPLVFLSVIFTGRSWCGLLCPMGAASEWANKKGLQRPIPAWLRWEGTPVVSFIFITTLGQTVGVRDHPEAIAEVFGGTMLLAIIIGFLYGRNKRAWCRHACPIGLLLGVFSRIGAVQFAPKRPKPGSDTYTEKGICPTMIDIPRKEESRHCIECFRCVNPKAKGGLALLTRRPGLEVENIRDHNPNMAEIWFFFLGTGSALGGFLWLVLPLYQQWRTQLATWFIDNELYWIGDSGPWWLMSVHPERREVFTWLDFIMIVGFMSLCAIALAAVLWSTTHICAWLAGKTGGDRTQKQRFVELGYQYAPVAMVSLIVGLGGELFEPLRHLGMDSQGIGLLKATLFVLSLLWSLFLGYRILGRQGVALQKRWIPLTPGIIGSAIVALAWWPALFGL
jgi:polyferredoxin